VDAVIFVDALIFASRKRAAELTTAFVAVFTGAFFADAAAGAVLGGVLTGTLELYFFALAFFAGALAFTAGFACVDFTVEVSAAPRHTPMAASTTHPTLGKMFIL
jgi:hypothetical protein